MIAKKLISVSAAALLAIGVLPCTAFAADGDLGTVRVIIENNTFKKDKGASWEGLLLDAEVALKNDSNMLTVVEDALKEQGKPYELYDWGGVMSINGVGGAGDYGWMLTLNDWFTSTGVTNYTVSDGTLQVGDVIDVQYSLAGGYDVGSTWGVSDTSLTELKTGDGTLDKEFAPETTEYTLTLSGVKDISVYPTALNKNFQVRTYKNTYAPDTDGYDPKADAHYRKGEQIEVVDGDKLIIGIGNPSWPCMEGPGYKETKYTINIVSDIKGDDLAAARETEKLINEIGEVTLEKEKAVKDAQTAFLRLTDSQKKLVANSDILDAAVKKLAELKKAAVDAAFDNMFSETADKLSKTEGAVGAEWKMIGLARAGKLPEASKEAFAKSLAEYVKTAKDGKLNDRRSTENSKESVAAAALGYDPTKYADSDILSPVKNEEFTSIQGISGEIWANIALTGMGSDGIHTKELLAAQLESGAFSFDGKTEDIDITAMCITALAKDKSAEDAVNKAMEWLSAKQQADGSFGNCESTAQVIIALSSVGIDCTTDERFVKDSVSLMDGLSAYYLGNGEFAHTKGDKFNDMATEQAFLALTSYYRFSNGKTAIYDFSDMKLAPYTVEKDSSPKTGTAAAGMIAVVLAGAALIALKKEH